jgi:hypothetical protein
MFRFLIIIPYNHVSRAHQQGSSAGFISRVHQQFISQFVEEGSQFVEEGSQFVEEGSQSSKAVW